MVPEGQLGTRFSITYQYFMNRTKDRTGNPYLPIVRVRAGCWRGTGIDLLHFDVATHFWMRK
jgi:hypothetical protein